MMTRTNSILIAAAAMLAVCVLWPIKTSGDWYPMHDSTHPARVYLMSQTIRSGQFPPIWAEGINSGYGYPLFHFYAPLFHMSATALWSVLAPVTSAIKAVLFISMSVGVLGVMTFAKRWGRLAALVAGFAFALAPYIAVNVYVRGAFSELLSICLIPWVFLATEKIKTIRNMIMASAALSLFVVSHNLIPILVLPMVAIWMLYHNRSQLKLLTGAIALSALLSAWFIGPLIFERHFTNADDIARTTEYAKHFVEPWQTWNSTWGYGGSAQGVEDGMSYKLGKLQIILGLTGLMAAVINRKKSLIVIGLCMVSAWLLATPLTRGVWDASRTLQIVQFPWRTLGVVTLFLAILSGYAVSQVRIAAIRAVLAAGVCLAIVGLNYKYFAPQQITYSSLDKKEISPADVPDIASIVPEYQPRWFALPEEPSQESFLEENDKIIIQRAYYPTWEVQVGGVKVPVSPSQQGLLAIPLISGEREIVRRQVHTPLERSAYMVTLAACISAAVLYKRTRDANL